MAARQFPACNRIPLVKNLIKYTLASAAGFREAAEAARARLEAIAQDNAADAAQFRADLINIARTTLSSKVGVGVVEMTELCVSLSQADLINIARAALSSKVGSCCVGEGSGPGHGWGCLCVQQGTSLPACLLSFPLEILTGDKDHISQLASSTPLCRSPCSCGFLCQRCCRS